MFRFHYRSLFSIYVYLCLTYLLITSLFQQYLTDNGIKEMLIKQSQLLTNPIYPLITFELDGRMANWMLEYSTLYLIGKKFNLTVQVLPIMQRKLEIIYKDLPLQEIDPTQYCICHDCVNCICPECTKWRKVLAKDFIPHLEQEIKNHKHILIWAFHSELILRNLPEMTEIFKKSIRAQYVNEVDKYLLNLKATYEPEQLVGVHVRRTDYIDWIEKNMKGKRIEKEFFFTAFDYFRKKYSKPLFLITSDDKKWCKENLLLQNQNDVIITELPKITSNLNFSESRGVSFDSVLDFTLLTRCNHSIYDVGSFGFWTSALAGGEVLLADKYSSIIHPLLKAIHKYKPSNWTLIDVSKLK